MAVDRARSAPRHRARVRAVLAALAAVAVLGSLAEGPSANLGVGWRRNQSPGQQVLVWHAKKWHNGKIKTLSESKIDVGLDGATDTSVIKRRDSIDVQPAMEDRGMSLPQLEQFWAHCSGECQGGRVVDPDKGAVFRLEEAPTWLIVKTFVKELTRGGERPLVDVMAEKWPEVGGPSPVTYFVSHAWDAPFYPILRQLKEVGNGTFWLDCFACTQGDRLELLDDSEVFARALQSSCTKAQVLCLDRRASALQRLWVIFEILRAYQAGKPLLIPSPEQLEWGYASIIWGKMRCTVESDRQYIMGHVSAVGEENVSQCVRDSLLRSFRARVDAALLEFWDGSLQVAETRNTLGIALARLGRPQEAKLEYEAALAIERQQLGSDHPEVAKTRNSLGTVLRNLGQPQEAKLEFEAALAILRRHLGSDHPSVATTRNNLGNVLRKLGQLQKAMLEHEAALAIWTQQRGSDHPEVAGTRNNLGTVLRELGQLQDAKLEYEAALAIWTRHLGSDHPEVAMTRNNLGTVLKDLGLPQEAKLEFEAALTILKLHFGDDHPHVRIVQKNLDKFHCDQPDA